MQFSQNMYISTYMYSVYYKHTKYLSKQNKIGQVLMYFFLESTQTLGISLKTGLYTRKKVWNNMQLEKSKLCTKMHVKNRKTSDEVGQETNYF